jgi:NAD-dependent DNA ligase
LTLVAIASEHSCFAPMASSKSSSLPFRIVARFDDFKSANAASEKLRAYFSSHASEWKDKELAVPDVVILTNVVAVSHAKKGGFGEAVKKVLEDEDLDAEVEDEDQGALTFGATFRLPMGKPGEELAKQLHAFFDQRAVTPKLKDWKTALFGNITLTVGNASGVAWTHEGSAFEMHMPACPASIDAIKKTLMAKKVEQLKLRLCHYDDLDRLDSARTTKEKAQARADAEHEKVKPRGGSDSDAPAGNSDFPTVGRRFLFTGKMGTLVRDDAKKRVEWLGGVAASSVSRDLDYLVVGDDGSPLYGHGAKGNKILAAEKLQAHGAGVKIISEKQFLELKRRE